MQKTESRIMLDHKKRNSPTTTHILYANYKRKNETFIYPICQYIYISLPSAWGYITQGPKNGEKGVSEIPNRSTNRRTFSSRIAGHSKIDFSIIQKNRFFLCFFVIEKSLSFFQKNRSLFFRKIVVCFLGRKFRYRSDILKKHGRNF